MQEDTVITSLHPRFAESMRNIDNQAFWGKSHPDVWNARKWVDVIGEGYPGGAGWTPLFGVVHFRLIVLDPWECILMRTPEAAALMARMDQMRKDRDGLTIATWQIWHETAMGALAEDSIYLK